MPSKSKKATSKSKKMTPKDHERAAKKLAACQPPRQPFVPEAEPDSKAAAGVPLAGTEGTGIGDGCEADKAPTSEDAGFDLLPHLQRVGAIEPVPQPPAALTLPLIADSATLFIQGAQQLTAQLLGTPESAPLLVCINEWLEKLGELKKLIAGDADGPISGLKAKVITDGEPWGERGSKQLTLAGAVVKVKAVNWRDESQPLTIADLDEKKVEAYLRGVPWNDPIEKVLACYMKMVPTWTLKDLPPVQAKNLNAMLADAGEDGQGLRQCLKDIKWQMMAPEMA